MSFQSQFRRFHESIQLKRFDENAELREKRDRILKRLRENMKQTFEPFNQGSYAMGTGVKPLDSDYDIDVGIVLNNVDWRTADPVTVKGWVYEAVKGHTARVEWRRPCITVYYQRTGEAVYHVDLAILVKDAYANQMRLAIGKQHSPATQREWQPDDRKGFMKGVEGRFSDAEDAAQFRRVIRYLKSWKDVHFASAGRAAPTGLSLTVAAFQWFQHTKAYQNGATEYDDLGATSILVSAILQRFGRVWDNGCTLPRISLQFPNAPYDDVFARMTNQQMFEFHGQLEQLSAWLEESRRTNAVTPLRRAFGDAFPEK